MKALVILILIVGGALSSCSKFESEVSLGQHRITYKVSAESGLWYGKYLGRNGEVCLCEAPYQPGEWTHSFATDNIPSDLYIQVTSEFFDDSTLVNKPDVTASIYINGELADIQTNSIADGKVEAKYPSATVFP